MVDFSEGRPVIFSTRLFWGNHDAEYVPSFSPQGCAGQGIPSKSNLPMPSASQRVLLLLSSRESVAHPICQKDICLSRCHVSLHGASAGHGV